MGDYIPSSEGAKIQWLWNLMVWMARDGAVNGLSHGFSAEEICEFYSMVLQAKLALDNSVQKQSKAAIISPVSRTSLCAPATCC